MGLERVAFLKQGVPEHLRNRSDSPGARSRCRALVAPTVQITMTMFARASRITFVLASSCSCRTGSPRRMRAAAIFCEDLRRTVRSMRLLGVDAPTFRLFPSSRDAMKAAYRRSSQTLAFRISRWPKKRHPADAGEWHEHPRSRG
jgi:alanyl-tRNA synthetase